MNRRGFLGKTTSGTLAGTTALASAQPPPAVPSQPLVKTPAAIMAPRSDGVDVVWAVSRLAQGKIEWQDERGGSGTAASDRFGLVPQGDQILRVRLEGLPPGQTGQLRAVTTAADNGERVTGPWKTFRTLDPGAATTRFAIWNDTHQNTPTLEKLHAATPPVDFLVWNGDTCNDWHQADALAPTLLHPAGQDISDNRPLLLVWGNHDVRGPWAFKVPEIVATPDGRPFCAFRSGPVAVVCLHTGEDKPDAHPSFGGRVAFEPLRQEQAAWLEHLIRQPDFRDAPYRVVCCHLPLRWLQEDPAVAYDQGGYDAYSRSSREAWHHSLVAWKAQIIISGHTHHPAWIPATPDYPYAQLVGGGPQPERATWIEANANASALTLVMRSLDGTTLESVHLTPLA